MHPGYLYPLPYHGRHSQVGQPGGGLPTECGFALLSFSASHETTKYPELVILRIRSRGTVLRTCSHSLRLEEFPFLVLFVVYTRPRHGQFDGDKGGLLCTFRSIVHCSNREASSGSRVSGIPDVIHGERIDPQRARKESNQTTWPLSHPWLR